MSLVGTKRPVGDVRRLVATESKPDMGRRAGFGRDSPKAEFHLAVPALRA
jgi:hypothetical protein